MAWWGKVIGGAFGFMLGGPLGAMLGASLGHRFDRSLGTATVRSHSGDQERVQAAFFTATFAVMGHIAKADGRVTHEELALAERLMSHLRLDPAQRQLAKALFNKGKRDDFELEPIVQQLRQECHRRGNLIRMFLEIQVEAALADGVIATQENIILKRVAQILRVTPSALEQLINRLSAASGGAHDKGQQLSLAAAYRILNVTKNTPLPEVRKAYRRLRSQHHPDKLVAKGLPEEMMKLANEKSHQIRTAWECIKQAHQQS